MEKIQFLLTAILCVLVYFWLCAVVFSWLLVNDDKNKKIVFKVGMFLLCCFVWPLFLYIAFTDEVYEIKTGKAWRDNVKKDDR